VITRPIGASLADYFSKPHAISGVNFGDGPTATVAVIAVAILVVYVVVARNDIQPTEGAEPQPVLNDENPANLD